MSLQSGAVTTLLSLIHIVVIPVFFFFSSFLFPSIMLCVICGTNSGGTSVGLTSRLKVGNALSAERLIFIHDMIISITCHKEWLIGELSFTERNFLCLLF